MPNIRLTGIVGSTSGIGRQIVKRTTQAGKYAIDVPRSIYNEITTTHKNLKNGFSSGWSIGERLAQAKKAGSVKSLILRLKGAVRKTEVKKDDLPAVLGSLGFASMIPGGTATGYVIGKIIKHLPF